MDMTINNISFRAKLGKNVLKQVSKEFNNDKTKIAKYEKMFDDVFAQNIDKNTVVDINKDMNFVYSNDLFPVVKYQSKSKLLARKDIAKSLINECSREISYSEHNLFKVIVSKSLKSKKDFQPIQQKAEYLSNKRSKKAFNETIAIAKRLLKENPDSELTNSEFSYMSNKMLQEEAETPGTELYDLVHNFGGLTFG